MNQAYSHDEDTMIRVLMLRLRAPAKVIARVLGRSPRGVTKRALKLGLIYWDRRK